jgi:hypothetical protein
MARKQIPVCQGCGHYTCSDCGAGFPSKDEYLRHRIDPRAHRQEPAPA